MKIFCCYTPAHEVLFREYFEKSLPSDFDLHPTRVALKGLGDFNSGEYLLCLERKLELILKSIIDYPEELLVWSDVDIFFYSQ